jgi:hypothetical protein
MGVVEYTYAETENSTQKQDDTDKKVTEAELRAEIKMAEDLLSKEQYGQAIPMFRQNRPGHPFTWHVTHGLRQSGWVVGRVHSQSSITTAVLCIRFEYRQEHEA